MALFGRKNKDQQIEETATKKAEITVAPQPVADSASAYAVIVRPYVTEKSALLNANGVYTFVVSKNATKPSVRTAVEKLYKVSVKQVRIVNGKPKMRQIGLRKGVRPGVKKAVVTLKAGQSIDLGFKA